MPSDVHSLTGKKVCLKNVDSQDLLSIVRKHFPSAMMEGSCGSYSFWVIAEEWELVAEAWLHREGWWLRLKEDKHARVS